jgi:hypothetical protein
VPHKLQAPDENRIQCHGCVNDAQRIDVSFSLCTRVTRRLSRPSFAEWACGLCIPPGG